VALGGGLGSLGGQKHLLSLVGTAPHLAHPVVHSVYRASVVGSH